MNGYMRLLVVAISLTVHSCIFSYSLGVENLSDSFLCSLSAHQDKGFRVGLIANQTSCDQLGARTVDVLLKRGVRVLYLLAPEHGFNGKTPAGLPVAHCVDRKTGIPIVSMYGAGGDTTITGKQINKNILNQIDVLFFDLQDSGMRHYTYISTMLCALESAALCNKKIVILDRPNPLGAIMEGPLVDADLKSFISIAPIPLRHGMTNGELARYFNQHMLKKAADLHVVPMRFYNREPMHKLSHQLSPNIPSIQSCYGYSFLGIMGEIEPFDVGVGSSMAFQSLLLPETSLFPAYEWSKVRSLLAKYGIHSRYYSYYNQRKRKAYSGLELSMHDIGRTSSFSVLLELLHFFKKLNVSLTFSKAFNKAMGTPLVQNLCKGNCQPFTMRSKVNTQLEQFYKQAQSSFLYDTKPRMHKV